MNKSTRIFILLLSASFILSCKKEKEESKIVTNKNCKFSKCYIDNTLAISYEYNSEGKIEKVMYYDSIEGNRYSTYTYIDNMIIERDYDKNDIKSNYEDTHYLNADGYVNITIHSNGSSSDTTFFTRDSDGYLIKKDNGRIIYNYSITNGNLVKTEEFELGELVSTITYEYYSDQPFISTLFESIVPIGKNNKNLVKKRIYSQTFSLSFDYEFNTDGLIEKINLTTSDGFSETDKLEYVCN